MFKRSILAEKVTLRRKETKRDVTITPSAAQLHTRNYFNIWTQGRYNMNAPSVSNSFLDLPLLQLINEYTQGKSHISVLSVERLLV